MKEPTMRPAARLSLAIVAALVLAACAGATEESASPEVSEPTEVHVEPTEMDDAALQRVADAAAATADEGTTKFEITIETAGTQGDDGTQPITVTGEEDFTAEQRRMVFQGPSGEMEMLIDGTDVYVEIPATEDEQWARLDLAELVGDDVGFGGPAGLPFRSPQDNLEILSNAVTAAEEAGAEDVRGASATRYDLTIDLTQASEDLEDANETFTDLSEQSGITELDMQVWVDDEDRIARIAYSVDLSQAEVEATEVEGAEVDADPQGTVSVIVEYFDYGAPVTIELPDESAVVDIDEEQIRDSMPQAPTGSSTDTDPSTQTGASPDASPEATATPTSG